MTPRQDREARTTAQELLDIQLGSAEDAKNLLDSFPQDDPKFRDRIEYWIDQLEEPDDR